MPVKPRGYTHPPAPFLQRMACEVKINEPIKYTRYNTCLFHSLGAKLPDPPAPKPAEPESDEPEVSPSEPDPGDENVKPETPKEKVGWVWQLQ